MKKRILCLGLALVLITSCFGCGKTPGTTNPVDTESSNETTTESTVESNSENVSEAENQPTTEAPTTEATTEPPTTPAPTTETPTPAPTEPPTQKPTQPPTQAITMTASVTNIELGEESKSTYITITGMEPGLRQMSYRILGDVIVSVSSGTVSGDTMEIIFTPISSGTAQVLLYLENTDKSVTINITVDKPTPADKTSLSISKIGGEYKYYISSKKDLYNVYKIDDVSYKIDTSYDGSVYITATVITSCVEQNVSNYDFIAVDYKLYNSKGIVVKSDNIYVSNYSIFEKYQTTIKIYNLEPDDYILYFTDNM